MHVVASGQGLVSSGMDALAPFQLHRPTSLEEALALYRDLAGPVTWAHGTTDLVAQFREGLRPSTVVSLRGIEELSAIEATGAGLLVGAGATHDQAATDPVLAGSAPSLQQQWVRIANPRVRFRATMGGNLLARRNRYELALLLGATGGVARFEGVTGPFDVPVRDLWDARTQGALLTQVRLPEQPVVAYDRALRPAVTVAVGGTAGATVTVAIGSAAVPPWFVDSVAATSDEIASHVADGLPPDRTFGPDRGVCQQILFHVTRRAAATFLGGGA